MIFLILDRDPVRGDHERRRPRGRGRRALHARRHARQADGDRRRPQHGPDHRRGGAQAARRDLARGRLLRRDGRRHEVRQGRRHRRHPDHRRSTSIGGIVIGVHADGHAVRRGRPALLAADDRRRPVRADPRAADLRRHRHPRHALGVREGPRLRRRGPDPRPAQGAARGRRRDHGLRARPRRCRRCRSCSSAACSSPSAGRCASSPTKAEREARRRRPRRRPRAGGEPAGAARRGARRAGARPARAGDRLRPRAAGRRRSARRHAARARGHDPPPDRLRARHGHPGRAHPRRRRRSTRTST